MPQQNNKYNPTDPKLNATVSASAGSGKTWLLITRLVRLLIDGAEPGNIIALTFTRKAAGEMQIRLNERLFEMATADESKLKKLLIEIDCDVNAETQQLASGLYEKLMHSLYPIRIQTFHSFCQDILSRFPLEADIPPGFELLEDSSMLERQAWQQLFDDAAKPKQTALNKHLDFIMQICNGPDNTHTALHNFLSHRSDWWAYTAKAANAVDFAYQQLSQSLQIDADTAEPIAQFLNDITTQKLKIFANLLRENKNKTGEKHANTIDQALDKTTDKSLTFSLIKSAFIKKDGDMLMQGRKHSAALEKKLGAENTEQFLNLHLELAEKIMSVNEQLKRLLSLKINNAWYFAGNHYVEIYQALKKDVRLLDFTDLEWKCYQLLQHSDNAHWVQYKIDQRIDHLLIDEFQDTNPTQWQLLSPILEEISANPEQRPRSVFLVGDEKQSIYSFRRANPALQEQASSWLAKNLNAKATPLDLSWRSSPAIIHCVNHVFEQDEIKNIMTSYTTHDTHLANLPGRVQICELFDADDNEDSEVKLVFFRNPLQQPRDISVKTLRHDEADYIAKQILHIVESPTFITDKGCVRAAEFGDVLILIRNRTHVDIYENALKQHNIAFIGNKKGGLLDNLEIQDLNCLLNTLITPFNNLSLAQVLKSPIFNASDDDLIFLSQLASPHHWYQRLLQAYKDPSSLSQALQRAARLLPHWQQLAENLPVHDCLDKIFSEGNIINRYIAANHPENKLKVASNCQRFLELSLETDNGRYPGISRFLQQLTHLSDHSDSPPEEPLPQSKESRVHLMTIHGSKGLESPIVFIADCNGSPTNKNAYATLVKWPANRSQPSHFQLQLSKDNTDQITQVLQQEKITEQSREELNLLYVALTRARERLYISGIASSKKKTNSWYKIIANGLEGTTQNETTVNNIICKIYEHLNYNTASPKEKTPSAAPKKVFNIDKRLLKPIVKIPTKDFMLSPSLITDELIADEFKAEHALTKNDTNKNTANLAKWRGTIIHRVLEQLCNLGNYPAINSDISNVHQQLTTEVLLDKPNYFQHLKDCINEASETFNNPELQLIFQPSENDKTYNEMPLMYVENTETPNSNNSQAVFGIIDRIIKSENEVLLIDYKSHQIDSAESSQHAAEKFAKQISYYRNGVKKLWPEHKIKTGIVLTHRQELIWL